MKEDLKPEDKEQCDNLKIVNINLIHKMKKYCRANEENI